MSNAERQRLFRERHPDYYRIRYQKAKARYAAWVAAQKTRAAEPLALPAPAEPLALPAMPVRLALPAPVEALPLFAPAQRERELVPVLPEINSFETIPTRAMRVVHDD